MYAQSSIMGYGLPATGAQDALKEIRYGLRSPNFSTRVQAVKDVAALLPAVLVEENAFIAELGKYAGEDLCGNEVLTNSVNDVVAYLNLALSDVYVTRNVDRMAQIAYFYNLVGEVVHYGELQTEVNTRLLKEVAELKGIVEKQDEDRKTIVALEEELGVRVECALINLGAELKMKDAEIAKLKKKLLEYEIEAMERDAMRQRLEKADLDVAEANRKAANLHQQVESLQCSLVAEYRNREDVQTELAQAENKYTELAEEIHLQKNRHEERISSLQGTIDRQYAYIQEWEEKVDVAEDDQNTLAGKEAELQAERSQRAVVESDLSDLQQELLGARKETEKYMMDVSDLKKVVEKQDARLHSFSLQEEAVTNLRSDVASKDELLLAVTTEVKSLKTKLEDVSKDRIRAPRSLLEALELIKPFTRQ